MFAIYIDLPLPLTHLCCVYVPRGPFSTVHREHNYTWQLHCLLRETEINQTSYMIAQWPQVFFQPGCHNFDGNKKYFILLPAFETETAKK